MIARLLRRPKIIISSLMILLLIIPSSLSSALPNSAYSLSLQSGAQVYEVKYYNEDLWKFTVNPLSSPSEMFGGEANISGAKSKLIPLTTGRNDLSTYGIFIHFFYHWLNVPYNSLLLPNGYDPENITGRYPYYYFAWDCDLVYWNFTSKPFKNYADHVQVDTETPYKHFIILQDPTNYSRILDDYNDFASDVNNDSTIQAANYSLPLLNGDECLWQLIINELMIANPLNSYLNQIINALNCTNSSVQDNTLVFQRSGVKFYTVEIKFNTMGVIDTIVMKTMQNEVFYQITSSYPQLDVYIILGVFGGAILGLVGIHIYKKSRQKKEIARNLK